MNVKKYDVRVRESRIPYLVAVGKTKTEKMLREAKECLKRKHFSFGFHR